MEAPEESGVLLLSENAVEPSLLTQRDECPEGVGKNTQNEAAEKISLWLDGALRAERRSFALALEKRHSLLVKECMEQHSAMFTRPIGIPLKQAVEPMIEATQQCFVEMDSNIKEPQELQNQAHRKRAVSSAQGQLQKPEERGTPKIRERTESGDSQRSSDSASSGAEESKASTSSWLCAASVDSAGSPPLSPNESARSGGSPASKKRSHEVFNDEDVKEEVRHFLHGVVLSNRFEVFFDVLIVANTVVMALESQYDGFDIGLDVKFPGFDSPGAEIWPDAKPAFKALDIAFGIVFTIELFLKIFGLGKEFIFDAWNLFDALIVLGWFVDAVFRGSLPIDPMMLRLARLARLMRLLKLLKTLKGIDPLFLMITTLKGSMAVLFWVFILMLVVQTMSALLMNQVLVSYYLELDNNDATKKDVFKYFGSFSRSMLSMFEITLGNWVPIARLLMDGVSEWFLLFTIFHKLTMGFAVISVINGIFTQETFKVAACDDTLMMMQKSRAMRMHTKKMQAFFEAADDSGDGFLDKDEFRSILQKPAVRTWLAAQDLDATDADTLYELLETGVNGLSAPELVEGVSKLKGPSRSIDLIMLMHNHEELKNQVQDIHQQMFFMKQNGPGLAPNNAPVADVLQVQEHMKLLIVARRLVGDLLGFAAKELVLPIAKELTPFPGEELTSYEATRSERSDLGREAVRQGTLSMI